MKDPSIAAFWLITLPQIVGGMDYDDEIKQKIWWEYKVQFPICKFWKLLVDVYSFVTISLSQMQQMNSRL